MTVKLRSNGIHKTPRQFRKVGLAYINYTALIRSKCLFLLLFLKRLTPSCLAPPDWYLVIHLNLAHWTNGKQGLIQTDFFLALKPFHQMNKLNWFTMVFHHWQIQGIGCLAQERAKLSLLVAAYEKDAGKGARCVHYDHQEQQLRPVFGSLRGQPHTVPVVSLLHYSLSKQLIWTSTLYKKQRFSQMRSCTASGKHVTGRDEGSSGSRKVAAHAFNAPTIILFITFWGVYVKLLQISYDGVRFIYNEKIWMDIEENW